LSMKKCILLTLLLVFLLGMDRMALAEEKDCWYLAQNGVHDFEQTDFSYATCTEAGYYEIECRQCGYSRKEISMEATGHDWVVTHREEPGASSYGIIIEACNNCNLSRSEKIYPKGTLYRGIKDSDGVKELQYMLIECGYLNDKMDGVFGKNTEAAVKAFQKAAGVSADGIAWPDTLDRLEREWEKRQKAAAASTPVPSPEPTAAPAGIQSDERFYPDFCYSWEDENGSTRFEYCRKHADLYQAQINLLSNPALIDYSYEMWQHEIESLYDEWIELLPEESRTSVAASKAFCLSMMDSQRTGMFDSYEVYPTGIFETDAEYGMEIWMRTHAAWLCQMLNTLRESQ